MGTNKKDFRLLIIVAFLLAGGALFTLIVNNSSDNADTSALSGVVDTDGDGYLDDEDTDPEHWNVGDRDMLMFATLAYEPVSSEIDRISGDTMTGNGKTVAENYAERNPGATLTDEDGDGYMDYFNYICEDAVRFDGDLADNECMIREDEMIGMQAQEYNTNELQKKIFWSMMEPWQTVGKEYYFGGVDENDQEIQFASIDEVKNWVIVDHTSEQTLQVFDEQARFEATTFRIDNNFVIAYRGTDFPDLAEWLMDISYGLDLSGEIRGYEEAAGKYAEKILAKYTAEYEANKEEWIEKYGGEPNFYITGHSLGGYLAQIGALDIVKNKPVGAEYLRDVVYYNGMGLSFWGGSRLADVELLKNWANETDNNGRKHKLMCYHNNGDLISALGNHVDHTGFYAASGAIIRHSKDTSLLQIMLREYKGKLLSKLVKKDSITAGLLGTLDSAANDISTILHLNKDHVDVTRLDEVADYYSYYREQYGNYFKNSFGTYGTLSVMDLLWFCHEPSASLFNSVSQGSLRGTPEHIAVKQNLSSDKKSINLVAEVNADVTDYNWTWKKDGKELGTSKEKALSIPNDSGIEIELMTKINSRSTNKESEREDRDTLVSDVVSIDTVAPKITIDSESRAWRVKRGNPISFIVTAKDDSNFSAARLSASDIDISGLGKNKVNVKVSSPWYSNDGKTVSWRVTLTSSTIGAITFKVAGGVAVDTNGNVSGSAKSKTITFGLLF